MMWRKPGVLPEVTMRARWIDKNIDMKEVHSAQEREGPEDTEAGAGHLLSWGMTDANQSGFGVIVHLDSSLTTSHQPTSSALLDSDPIF